MLVHHFNPLEIEHADWLLFIINNTTDTYNFNFYDINYYSDYLV